jgi:hypothetical protein
VVRRLCFVTLTVTLAMSATGAHAASAAVTCVTAAGVRHIERVDGSQTKAAAEHAVRARCRASALTAFARSAPSQERVEQRVQKRLPERVQQQDQQQAHQQFQDRACRRYPNLC